MFKFCFWAFAQFSGGNPLITGHSCKNLFKIGHLPIINYFGGSEIGSSLGQSSSSRYQNHIFLGKYPELGPRAPNVKIGNCGKASGCLHRKFGSRGLLAGEIFGQSAKSTALNHQKLPIHPKSSTAHGNLKIHLARTGKLGLTGIGKIIWTSAKSLSKKQNRILQIPNAHSAITKLS